MILGGGGGGECATYDCCYVGYHAIGGDLAVILEDVAGYGIKVG